MQSQQHTMSEIEQESSFFFSTRISFSQHRDTQETLTVLDRLDLDAEKPSAEETAKKFGFEDDFYSGNLSWWQKTKPKIWSMFDEPYSSSAAKVCMSTSVTPEEKGEERHDPVVQEHLDLPIYSTTEAVFAWPKVTRLGESNCHDW